MAIHHIKKIISGGQAGADRAGLDIAIELGLPYGGAIPKGRKAEDGPLSAKYKNMTELDTSNYPPRTKKNVEDSHVTIMFIDGTMGTGTGLTLKLCQKLHRPHLVVNFNNHDKDHVQDIVNWLNDLKPQIINIAGSRESTTPGIYAKSAAALREALAAVQSS